MTVAVFSTVPDSLRGHMTWWLLEISSGVLVGNLSTRVRECLWTVIQENIGSGRTIMIFHASNEQRLSFLTPGDPWMPTDFEGLALMIRPGGYDDENASGQRSDWGERHRRPGIGNFEKRRRVR